MLWRYEEMPIFGSLNRLGPQTSKLEVAEIPLVEMSSQPSTKDGCTTSAIDFARINEKDDDAILPATPLPAPDSDPNETEDKNDDKIDEEPPLPAPSKKNRFHFALAFTALSVVAFTSALDATILAVALPIVTEKLKMSTLEAFWAGISFLLSSVVFQPLHTAMSDIFGRKAILYLCILFFVAGSLIVGLAQNAEVLIAGRTIQGIGGGGIEALAEIILTDITTLKERPKYIGILGLMWAAGSIVGPIIGGVFAEYVTWRWIAWINLPLMAVAMILIPLFLTLAVDKSSVRSKLKRVDYMGMALLIVGLTSFVLALCWGGQLFRWNRWQTIFPLVGGLVLLAVLARYEKYPREPIFKYRLFATWTSTLAFFGSFIQGILIWVLVYYLVLYFQGALQHAPLQSAIDAFPLMFTLTPSAVICAVLIDKTRRYLWTVWLGWVLCTVGFGTMILLDNKTSRGVYSIVQIAPGVGTGFLLSALAVPVQAAMSVDDAGLAMGTQVFFRAVGALVGVAFGSSVFTNEFSRALQQIKLPPNVNLPDATDAVFFLTSIDTLDISAETRSQLLRLYADPIKLIWIVATGLAGVGLISSLFMKELTLEREELGRQALQVHEAKSKSSEDSMENGSPGP
ncbi:hypothetical protein HYFRA_00010403 [Hymenoscyphus fraxineus]|uniref:Major facilitator superfamily (MFS) profile domain-containing protein n=1 Tax=Hymenoscyphus fraxineus TaxID=746836 RepID=A0A9N9L5T7_9HELO|nr:hypothetical protein HYFRA_00010403 [Hymenoscyphus fraxineus]